MKCVSHQTHRGMAAPVLKRIARQMRDDPHWEIAIFNRRTYHTIGDQIKFPCFQEMKR